VASGKATKRKREAVRTPPPPARPRPASSGPDRRLWVILAVVGAVLIAVVAGVLLTTGGDDEDLSAGGTLPGAEEVIAPLDGIPQEGVVLGEEDAPVTLVQFIDLQCPFCREYEVEALPPLVEEQVRDGQLRIETRGLSFIGPDSERGMRAVLAAGLQNRAYELTSLFYANQGAENAGWLSDDLIAAAGRSIPGLDVEKLFDDMGSGTVDDLLEEHAADAETRGVNSTPTVLVGPTGGDLKVVQIESPSDVASIEEAIEAAAAR
jgi:protein-disulfide isomerase